jgi:hypothetical protein
MQPMKGSACNNEDPVFSVLGMVLGGIFFFPSFRGVAMPLAQAKNGDKQFWKIKLPYSQ